MFVESYFCVYDAIVAYITISPDEVVNMHCILAFITISPNEVVNMHMFLSALSSKNRV